MKLILLGTIIFCVCMGVHAQSYDINEDGQVNVADVATLVEGVTKGEKGKLYYSKEEVDALLYSLKKRLNYLEKNAGITLPYTPYASFPKNNICIKLGDTFKYKVKTDSDGDITYYSSNPSSISVDSNTGIITAISLGNATINAAIKETECFASISSSYNVTVLDKKYGEYITPSVVDLGLPSGTLWLDRNVYSNFENTSGTTIENNFSSQIFSNYIQKCMAPSKEQWEELLNCNYIIRYIDDNKCYDFTGLNGNHLIIPYSNEGYWTSTRNSDIYYQTWYYVDMSVPSIKEWLCYRPDWLSSSGQSEFYYKKMHLRLVVE